MGTSTSMAEFAGKMDLAATNVREARKASFRTAENRMRPRFRDEARAAAGGDRRLSRHRSQAPLDAQFKVTESEFTSLLYIRPTGPWGIRDNTDVGGKTGAHGIRPRRARMLKFIGADGLMTYRRFVYHLGSARAPFWQRAREESFRYIQKRIPEETIRAIEAALSGSGFRGRS
jgi:hypothetical protein